MPTFLFIPFTRVDNQYTMMKREEKEIGIPIPRHCNYDTGDNNPEATANFCRPGEK